MKIYYKSIYNTGLFIALGLMAFVSQAQTTSGTIVRQVETMNATATVTNTSVRLIDSKGTIKYLQVANGLTSYTDLTNDRQTTTWQLGGILSSNTYIDVNGNVFGLDGIELVQSSTLSPSTDATDQSDHGTGTGWTLLVRDEATGAIKKLLATDLIQSGFADDTADADEADAGEIAITATGIPTDATDRAKIWVFRNGAKLIYGTDFAITDNTVTVKAVDNSWRLFEGDVFEVQWVK